MKKGISGFLLRAMLALFLPGYADCASPCSSANMDLENAMWHEKPECVDYMLKASPASATTLICGKAQLLDWAVKNNRKKLAEKLLKQGVSPNGVYKEVPGAPGGGAYQCEVVPLFTAVVAGNMEMVKLLVEAGASPNMEGRHTNPLMLAVDGGNAEIARYLLRHGANSNLPTVLGYPRNNAFEAATAKGMWELADYMVKHGLNKEHALYRAVTYGDREAAMFLAMRRADMNSRKRFPYPMRDGTTRYREFGPLLDEVICLKVESPGADPVRLLLEAGADPGKSAGGASGLLERAAICGNTGAIEALKKWGAAPDLSRMGGAVIFGTVDDVRKAKLRNPGSVRTPVWGTAYPLELAVSFGDFEKVKYLADCAPDLIMKTVPGEHPFPYNPAVVDEVKEGVTPESSAEQDHISNYLRQRFLEYQSGSSQGATGM